MRPRVVAAHPVFSRPDHPMPAVARKPAARPRAAVPAAPPSWLQRFVRQLYQPGILFPVALALAGIVTWPVLAGVAAPNLSHDPVYHLTAHRLQLPAAHPWLPDDVAERVLDRAGAKPDQPLSLLRDGLAERLAKSLELEPWVKSVTRVEQRRDGTIAVELAYRRPVLMVSTSKGMYAVDIDGVLLPPEDFTAEDIQKFPLARNVRSLPRVGCGGGLAGRSRFWGPHGSPPIWLPRAMRPTHGPSLDSRPFSCPARRRRRVHRSHPAYELLTSGGSRILWGCARGPMLWNHRRTSSSPG